MRAFQQLRVKIYDVVHPLGRLAHPHGLDDVQRLFERVDLKLRSPGSPVTDRAATSHDSPPCYFSSPVIFFSATMRPYTASAEPITAIMSFVSPASSTVMVGSTVPRVAGLNESRTR